MHALTTGTCNSDASSTTGIYLHPESDVPTFTYGSPDAERIQETYDMRVWEALQQHLFAACMHINLSAMTCLHAFSRLGPT